MIPNKLTSRGQRRTSRGFTVIELIACIVIMGILTAVAAPSVWDNTTFATRGYADELASSLRYAQRVAVVSGCKVQVTVTAAAYSGFQQPTFAACGGNGAWSSAVMRPDGTALSGSAPNSVTASPAAAVQFEPEGNVSTGNISFTVGSHTVSVDAVTGRVSLQ